MPDKKSTSANSKSVAENGPGGSDLGRASYRAEQARDAVIIFAFGWHPTPGYVDFFEQSPIEVFPPEFIFRSIPPGGMWPQVLAPFAIWVMFGASEPIKTVTVHDADGPHEVPVEQMPKTLAAAKGRGTWVSGAVMRRGGGGILDRPTTMATGEEGGGPTTMAVGEEDVTAPTTMATGEETGGPTTMAVGEEEARMTTLRLGEEEPPITTMALGEEGTGGPTTMAVGEETGGPTTMALGEEDARMTAALRPPPTTLAVAEEAVATTLALGEEGTTTLRLTPTTLAVGEEDPTTLAVGEEGGPTTLALGEENPTTDALGEEGPTTMALGEETTAVVRSSPFGTF
jgi:hypothetical protein